MTDARAGSSLTVCLTTCCFGQCQGNDHCTHWSTAQSLINQEMEHFSPDGKETRREGESHQTMAAECGGGGGRGQGIGAGGPGPGYKLRLDFLSLKI